MKIFRELTVYVESDSADEWIEYAERVCPELWSRDLERESRGSIAPDKVPLCFVYGGEEYLPPAELWMFKQDDSSWYVSNIVPREQGELSKDEYNAILGSFARNVLEPTEHAIKTGRFNISDDVQTLASVSNVEVEAAFRAFSGGANKSTGSSHPSDRRRWFQFLRLASSHPAINYELVYETLVEEGWPVDVAHRLASEFSFGVDLLRFPED